MSDRTIIRPGGRKPRKGGGSGDDGGNKGEPPDSTDASEDEGNPQPNPGSILERRIRQEPDKTGRYIRREGEQTGRSVRQEGESAGRSVRRETERGGRTVRVEEDQTGRAVRRERTIRDEGANRDPKETPARSKDRDIKRESVAETPGSERVVRDRNVKDRTVRDSTVRDSTVRERTVRDRAVRDESTDTSPTSTANGPDPKRAPSGMNPGHRAPNPDLSRSMIARNIDDIFGPDDKPLEAPASGERQTPESRGYRSPTERETAGERLTAASPAPEDVRSGTAIPGTDEETPPAERLTGRVLKTPPGTRPAPTPTGAASLNRAPVGGSPAKVSKAVISPLPAKDESVAGEPEEAGGQASAGTAPSRPARGPVTSTAPISTPTPSPAVKVKAEPIKRDITSRDMPGLDTTVVGESYKATFRRLSATAESNMHSLVGMVSPFLSIIARVRKSTSMSDTEEFRNYCIEQIRQYEMRNFGIEDNSNLEFYASFGLCCMVDEFISNTPWGTSANWSDRSMLMEFHMQELGGAVFFDLLEKMLSDPGPNLPVLELYFVCLDLGYEGKYAGNQSEKRRLTELTEKVFKAIEAQQEDTEYKLTESWEGLGNQGKSLTRSVPHWVIFATAAMLVVGTFTWFHYRLTQQSDPVFRNLMEVTYTSEALTVVPWNRSELITDGAVEPDLERQTTDYSVLLKSVMDSAVARELVQLIDEPGKTILRLQHRNLFPSGSGQIADRYALVVAGIGDTLAGQIRRVDVTGHSDDIPIRSSPRFANNWELSKARAQSVQQVLSRKIPGATVKARGLADSKNVVANDSAENRARNRRVEIVLYK